MLLDTFAVKLIKNHLESIGNIRLPATLLYSRRLKVARDANAWSNVSMTKCWSGCSGMRWLLGWDVKAGSPP